MGNYLPSPEVLWHPLPCEAHQERYHIGARQHRAPRAANQLADGLQVNLRRPLIPVRLDRGLLGTKFPQAPGSATQGCDRGMGACDLPLCESLRRQWQDSRYRPARSSSSSTSCTLSRRPWKISKASPTRILCSASQWKFPSNCRVYLSSCHTNPRSGWVLSKSIANRCFAVKCSYHVGLCPQAVKRARMRLGSRVSFPTLGPLVERCLQVASQPGPASI